MPKDCLQFLGQPQGDDFVGQPQEDYEDEDQEEDQHEQQATADRVELVRHRTACHSCPVMERTCLVLLRRSRIEMS